MFDGMDRLPMREPTPPRPAPIDVAALLPSLHRMASEAMLEHLAVTAAINIDCAGRWVADNWGTGADVLDHGHPFRTAALDESSAAFKFAETIAALSDACWHYRVETGHDGVALVRQTITQARGASVARQVLGSLERVNDACRELDELLGPICAAEELPPLTEEQRRTSAAALVDHLLSYPGMTAVRLRLDALEKAYRAAGQNPCEGAITAALNDLGHALGDAVQSGVEAQTAQTLLAQWSIATGVPSISVQVEDKRAPLR